MTKLVSTPFFSLFNFLLLLIIPLSMTITSSITFADNSMILRLATTTSTQNSGLLQSILPEFEQQSGYKVHVIAVGTGKALKMGRDGDVDLLMVHAPTAEQQFIAAGHGINRYALMYNDFVLVGPANDPANAAKAKTIAQAMAQIAYAQSLFISRGDDSGTHKKELKLWPDTRKKSRETDWYREAGQGMGKVLQMSDELNAYTLTDRGTWLSYAGKLRLKIVFSGDPDLFNPYSLITLNPEHYPELNHTGAKALINWLISPAGQQLIDNYRVRNSRLFTPSADPAQLADLIWNN